jgi:hypothetical protein
MVKGRVRATRRVNVCKSKVRRKVKRLKGERG